MPIEGSQSMPTEEEIDNSSSEDKSDYGKYDDFVEKATEEEAQQEVDRP